MGCVLGWISYPLLMLLSNATPNTNPDDLIGWISVSLVSLPLLPHCGANCSPPAQKGTIDPGPCPPVEILVT